ncbi:MAG: HlyD family efflux transporter periplasmic adaptor subunit [Phycisphaerales bacterium]|nr:HlyD family efflux transporter periplasmic adaptor subunit [Phycisphaerales bacterium]
MKKYIIATIIVAALGGGSWWWWKDKQAKAAEAATAAAANQTTAKVVRKNWRLSVFANGNVVSNSDVDMKAQVGGTITYFPYQVSNEIAPETKILEIDPTEQKRFLSVRQAIVAADDARIKGAEIRRDIAKMNLETTRTKVNATLASAKAKAQDSKNKAARTEELYQRKLASKEDLETALTAATLAASEVASVEAAIAELEQQQMQIDVQEQEISQLRAQKVQNEINVDLAKLNVDYCTVKAPEAIDKNDPPRWRVARVTGGLQPGSLIQSGTTGQTGGTVLMTLSDISHIFVVAMVDEADYGLVEVGQDVVLTADASKGTQFKGKVVRLAGDGRNISQVIKGEVKIEITSRNKDLLNLLNMTTNVEIIQAEKKDALTVPVLAVSLQRIDIEKAAATTEPATTEPATTEPATTEPATTEPATTEPATTQKRADRSGDKLRSGEGPFPAQVEILKDDGSIEIRDIQVGRHDGQDYLVISGLEEDETVVIKKLGNTRWKSSPRRPGSGSSPGAGGRGR